MAGAVGVIIEGDAMAVSIKDGGDLGATCIIWCIDTSIVGCKKRSLLGVGMQANIALIANDQFLVLL